MPEAQATWLSAQMRGASSFSLAGTLAGDAHVNTTATHLVISVATIDFSKRDEVVCGDCILLLHWGDSAVERSRVR